MDIGALIQVGILAATQPNFDFVQTLKDIGALQNAVSIVKHSGKFDLAALQRENALNPAIDAAARLAPLLAKIKSDPHVTALLASLG